MAWLITKYAITAGIVVLVSEVAKRSDKLGALVASLPLITLIAMIWLYAETQSLDKVSNHAWYTFWYVIPTLPMFLILPWLLTKIGFWPSLGTACLITMLCYIVFGLVTRRFGIDLF